jgi:glutathione S-transferase
MPMPRNPAHVEGWTVVGVADSSGTVWHSFKYSPPGSFEDIQKFSHNTIHFPFSPATIMAAPYELIYYTGVPGRGEHVRLALEEAEASYTDTGSLGSFDKCREVVTKHLTEREPEEKENPPYYAPPMFKHGNLIISQTPNILLYLGPKLGLAGSREGDLYRVNALALTALDGLSNEVHDSHHPIGVELYYEDQKEESKRRSQEWIKTRLPKHLGYWERALTSDDSGPWLLGSTFTYADLVLFQVSLL